MSRRQAVQTADFDYTLPADAVAQYPRPRGTSRLLVLERRTRRTHHTVVNSLPSWLCPGDLLLINDVRVIPARLHGLRPGGGQTELLLVKPVEGGEIWEAMVRPGRRLRPGMVLTLRAGSAVVTESGTEGRWRISFDPSLEKILAQSGEVPLPPYIRRDGGATPEDGRRYQTVYAATGRAVAAPTAGLHFTPELLDGVAARGVEVAPITLHVGPGTFRPVQAKDPREHRLDPEDYEISAAAAAALNRALAAGRRIVCVGTTSCRTLEHALATGMGTVRPGWGTADTYLLPGRPFRGTGALMTNFHLPRSTLLMLVAALGGLDLVLRAYGEALEQGYRLYSFGDAMLVV